MTDVLAKPAILDRLQEFVEFVCAGRGPLNAALAVGWTPKDLRELETSPQFQQLMGECETRKLESLEQVAFEMAMNKNASMLQMILYCKGAERGWRPPTQRVAVHHQGTVAVETIEATKKALLEIMAEHGAEALAIGGPLDGAIEATVTD